MIMLLRYQSHLSLKLSTLMYSTMAKYAHLYYLTFMWLVAVILIMMVDDWTTAAAALAVIAGIMTITTCFVRLGKMHCADGAKSNDRSTNNDEAPPAQDTASVGKALSSVPDIDAEGYEQNPNTLGDKWEKQHVYNSTFDAMSGATVMQDSPAELAPDVDTRNALMSGQRFQQKRSIDGYVTKTADYYANNFAGELDEVEKKPWWGNSEF